jgi:hypothetical protein
MPRRPNLIPPLPPPGPSTVPEDIRQLRLLSEPYTKPFQRHWTVDAGDIQLGQPFIAELPDFEIIAWLLRNIGSQDNVTYWFTPESSQANRPSKKYGTIFPQSATSERTGIGSGRLFLWIQIDTNVGGDAGAEFEAWALPTR